MKVEILPLRHRIWVPQGQASPEKIQALAEAAGGLTVYPALGRWVAPPQFPVYPRSRLVEDELEVLEVFYTPDKERAVREALAFLVQELLNNGQESVFGERNDGQGVLYTK